MALNAFQTSVSSDPSPGIEGGFAGGNPYFSVITPDEGMFVASSVSPPLVGNFGFANVVTGIVSATGTGTANFRIGFVHRDQPSIVNGAGLFNSSSLAIVGGQGLGLAEDGTFWARFAAGATIGQKVYASFATGAVSSAVTGAASTTTLSVTTNTTTAITYTGGALYPGTPITGGGIPAGAYIVSVNAAAGTAVLSAAATASATVTATVTTNYETAFTVRSTAAAGELAKISVRG